MASRQSNALPKRLAPRSPRTNARDPSPHLLRPSEQTVRERRFVLPNAKVDPASSRSSKTREAKLVVVWTAEKLNEGIPERGSVSYSAAIESALDTDKELSPFAQRVDREAPRRGFHDAERRVILGDGALWIWNIASELFPDADRRSFPCKTTPEGERDLR